jgi:hypothetical protein
MSWKRVIKIPLILAANAWSWGSYVLGGFPQDKEVYRVHLWNWLSPDLEEHWLALERSGSETFHELKNVGVEYARLHAQPAMKSLCMFLVLGWSLWVISTLALVFSLFL